MKKTVSFFLVALIMLSVSVGAFASTYYKEPETGVSFTVPDGWKQVAFNTDKEILKSKFKYRETENLIMYGFYDVWEGMGDYYKQTTPREEINNSSFTDDDFAAVAGTLDFDSWEKNVGGKTYKIISYDTSITLAGITVEYHTFGAYYVSNGYMFQFLYEGDTDEAYSNDLYSLLDTVEYPAYADTKTEPTIVTDSPSDANSNIVTYSPAEKEPKYTTFTYTKETPNIVTYTPSNQSSDNQNAKVRSVSGELIAIIVLSVAVVGLFVLILASRKKKKDTAADASNLQNTVRETIIPLETQNSGTVICANCGKEIKAGSKFCKYCGNKFV